ncbi:hypothetical protein [Pelomonas sp. SE-A7]|uniref:hypothetical protein n=1 Tax=Pelomonas sp. SE-A7 TaxID=3054953 RepID=UPI00259C9BF9|nr:hypothetical protein [Pelomonas sp. SE-A7]MDM4768553.1 hypothetical protein [Pelomonas sp. SE-A7]
MGTFGTGITADDAVADVIDFISEQLKYGTRVSAASQKAMVKFRDLELDPDEAPLLWLGLAAAQWKYGAVDAAVLTRVREDISTEKGLGRWRDDLKLLAKRKAALQAFLAKIEQPNSKPSLPSKPVARCAPYQLGDCLSVLLADGRYTAALVVGVDNSNPEQGANLIAALDYLEPSPPAMDVFEARRWLFRHHGKWGGKQDISWYLPVRFRQESKRFTVVGASTLRATDPSKASSYSAWSSLGLHVVLSREAAGERNV